MMNSQDSYYEDEEFQLELYLQTVRRELVDMLDEYKFQDCLACNRLKCNCSKKTSLRSTTVSVASSDSVFLYERDRAYNDIFYKVAPPACSLPTPPWTENMTSNGQTKAASEKVSPIFLNNWIRASIPNVTQSTSSVSFPVPRKLLDHIDYSWPPFPQSIWSKERQKETTVRERILRYESEKNGNSSVEEFFIYFSGILAILKNESHVDG